MVEQDLLEGNKYFKWYWSICNRAKDRVLSPDIYVEKHHIYPKSIYGQNQDLVKLTAKEHYIVHLLLWWGLRSKYGTKDKNTKKMAGAFSMMNSKSPDFKNQRYNSKNYELLRIAYNEINTGREYSVETRKKISESKKGNTYRKGQKCSDEMKRKNSELKIGNKNLLGFKFSDESKNKMSESQKGNTNRRGKKCSEKTIELIKEKRKLQKNIKKGTRYIIETPDNNIIKIETRAKVREYLNCSDAFFSTKYYNGYKLLSMEKII